MRILWFTNTPGLISGKKDTSGGWISSLQEKLQDKGSHELGLVFYSDKQTKPFREGATHYFPIKRKGNTRMKRKWMQFLGATEKDENLEHFVAVVNQFQPDIIHVHGTENPFGLIIPHVGNIPVLVSIQGILNVIIKKYFSSIDSYRFSDWRKNWDFFTAKNFTIIKKKADIEREILSHVRFLAGRTDWDRQVARVLAPQASYHHIDESLRPVFYGPKWKRPEWSSVKLFSIISDQPYKGVKVMLEAAIELHRSGFDFDWYVAGLDWGSDMLRMFHGEKDLQGVGLHLMGRLTQEQIVKELLSAHCFIQVSQIENSSNSLGEAMLLGVPCIATATGGTSSMLKDTIEGVLVPEGDPFCLAGSIIEYSTKYEELVAMGSAARIRALNRHDPNKVVKQLFTTYNEIIIKR